MINETISIEEIASKISSIEDYVKQATAAKKELQAKLCSMLKVEKEGQESQTFNIGDYKIVKKETTKYTLDKKALKNGAPEGIPKGIFVQDWKLDLKAFKDSFEEYSDVLSDYVSSSEEETVTVTKIDKGE